MKNTNKKIFKYENNKTYLHIVLFSRLWLIYYKDDKEFKICFWNTVYNISNFRFNCKDCWYTRDVSK